MYTVFVFSGCDINSPRQPGLNGETPDICKTLESPLHLGINIFLFLLIYLFISLIVINMNVMIIYLFI